MSWAKISTINNDLSFPLNLQFQLEHIDLIGDTYNALADKDLSYQFIKNPALYSHTIAAKTITNQMYSNLIDLNTGVGEFFKKAYGVNYSELNDINTWEDLKASDYSFKRKLLSDDRFVQYLNHLSDKDIWTFLLDNGAMAGLRANYKFIQNAMSTSENIDRFREKYLDYLCDDNTPFMSNIENSSFVIPSDVEFMIAIGVGAGGGDTTVTTVSGGNGGGYYQQLLMVTDEMRSAIATVNHSGTSLYLGDTQLIALGVGEGAAQNTTPEQSGVLVPVSTCGSFLADIGSYDQGIGAGGGGYGGGGGGGGGQAGTAADGRKMGRNGGGGYGGAIGGTYGVNGTAAKAPSVGTFFPNIEGTGGAGGTGSASTGVSGVYGGGGAGGYNSKSTAQKGAKQGQGGMGCIWLVY